MSQQVKADISTYMISKAEVQEKTDTQVERFISGCNRLLFFSAKD